MTHTDLHEQPLQIQRGQKSHLATRNSVWRYVNHCKFWWPINQTVPGFNCEGSVCVHVSAVPLRGTQKNHEKTKKTTTFSDSSRAPGIFSLPFLPFARVSFSPPSLCSPHHTSPLPPLHPCWIGGVNTGRARALFHHARAGAGRSCRAPALGSKVYCGFHFTFPQPITEPRRRAWTLTPAKNSTQKMVWRQFHNCIPLPSLNFPRTTPFPFFQLASFMCWQSLGKKEGKQRADLHFFFCVI